MASREERIICRCCLLSEVTGIVKDKQLEGSAGRRKQFIVPHYGVSPNLYGIFLHDSRPAERDRTLMVLRGRVRRASLVLWFDFGNRTS